MPPRPLSVSARWMLRSSLRGRTLSTSECSTTPNTYLRRSVTSLTEFGTSPDAVSETSAPTPAQVRCNASRECAATAGPQNEGFGTEYGTKEVADLLKC